MSFFKDVANFFSQEVPKFFTKTVPSVIEPETYAPDLIPLRKSVETLKVQVPAARERFYAEKAALASAQDNYETLSEDFQNMGFQSPTGRGGLPQSLVLDLNKTQKTFRDIAQVSRTVSGVVTLGLTELIYVHADVQEQRRTLTRQKAILTGTKKRFDHAIKELQSARKMFEGHIAEMKAEMAAAGIAPGADAASKMTAAQAQRDAREAMAARLLGLETDIETIATLTGLSNAEIANITPFDPASDDADNTATDDMMTDEEKDVLSGAQG